MQELSIKEQKTVNGGHPVVAIIGFIMRSTVTRNIGRGLITGGTGYLGYEAANQLSEI